MSANCGGQSLSYAAAKMYLQRTYRSYFHKSSTSLQQKCKRDDALRRKVLALIEGSVITRKVSSVVEFKLFVNRFYYKSRIFQPVLLQKVIFSSK